MEALAVALRKAQANDWDVGDEEEEECAPTSGRPPLRFYQAKPAATERVLHAVLCEAHASHRRGRLMADWLCNLALDNGYCNKRFAVFNDVAQLMSPELLYRYDEPLNAVLELPYQPGWRHSRRCALLLLYHVAIFHILLYSKHFLNHRHRVVAPSASWGVALWANVVPLSFENLAVCIPGMEEHKDVDMHELTRRFFMVTHHGDERAVADRMRRERVREVRASGMMHREPVLFSFLVAEILYAFQWPQGDRLSWIADAFDANIVVG